VNRQVVFGAVASVAVSAAGWRANSLTGRGALAATVVGTAISVGSSWRGMVVLGTFFVSSSVLSRSDRNAGVVAKGSRRDERQVLANGAVAAIGALVGGKADQVAGLSLVAGALAAATADTWATELGSGSGSVPRLAWSGRAVPRGTSGGVTQRGSFASLAGAATIGVVGTVVVGASDGWLSGLRVGSGVVVAGVAGSLVDSLLGELVQERRRCPICGVLTESRVHRCGAATVHVAGVRGVDNDLVNVACTAVGCLVMTPFVLNGSSWTDG
jgi:uncharacterized protein (TIGR00297 family)